MKILNANLICFFKIPFHANGTLLKCDTLGLLADFFTALIRGVFEYVVGIRVQLKSIMV